MNAEIKTKWVEALRSGEYTQGKDSLKHKRKEVMTHCCLGVLCELYVKETKTGEFRTTVGGGHTFIANEKKSSLYPPEEVVKWAGLDSNNPRIFMDEIENGVGEFNDTFGKNFTDIADAIEKQL